MLRRERICRSIPPTMPGTPEARHDTASELMQIGTGSRRMSTLQICKASHDTVHVQLQLELQQVHAGWPQNLCMIIPWTKDAFPADVSIEHCNFGPTLVHGALHQLMVADGACAYSTVMNEMLSQLNLVYRAAHAGQ